MNLKQLRTSYSTHGRAAVEMAKWGAVCRWTMQHNRMQLPHFAASELAADARRLILGKASRLSRLHPSDRIPLDRKAISALVAWQQAGSPGIHRSISRTRTFIEAAHSAAAQTS